MPLAEFGGFDNGSVYMAAGLLATGRVHLSQSGKQIFAQEQVSLRALNQVWRRKDMQPSLLEISLRVPQQCLRENVLERSFTLLPWWRWDGHPCSSSDTRVIIDVLKTMEAPENGHIGAGPSLP